RDLRLPGFRAAAGGNPHPPVRNRGMSESLGRQQWAAQIIITEVEPKARGGRHDESVRWRAARRELLRIVLQRTALYDQDDRYGMRGRRRGRSQLRGHRHRRRFDGQFSRSGPPIIGAASERVASSYGRIGSIMVWRKTMWTGHFSGKVNTIS